MDIQEFLGLAVVSALTSVVIQLIKKRFGTDGLTTKALTIALALIVGGGYVWLRSSAYWESVLAVLAGASTVYAFFIKE